MKAKNLILLAAALVISCLLQSCASMSGASSAQRKELEGRLVGKEAWLKRDTVIGLSFENKFLPAGDHVYIEKVTYAPAVILHLRTDDGKSHDFNATKGPYNEARFNRTIRETFAFSSDELEESFAEYWFEFEADDGGPMYWEGEGFDILLTVPDGKTVFLDLGNTGSEPLMVDWGLSSIVDLDGRAHKIVPGTTRGKDMGRSLPPSVVPPGARLKEFVLAEDLVDLARDETESLFPEAKGRDDLVGKQIVLMLAVRRGDQPEYATCTFTIAGVGRSVDVPD